MTKITVEGAGSWCARPRRPKLAAFHRTERLALSSAADAPVTAKTPRLRVDVAGGAPFARLVATVDDPHTGLGAISVAAGHT